MVSERLPVQSAAAERHRSHLQQCHNSCVAFVAHDETCRLDGPMADGLMA